MTLPGRLLSARHLSHSGTLTQRLPLVGDLRRLLREMLESIYRREQLLAREAFGRFNDAGECGLATRCRAAVAVSSAFGARVLLA